jgi:hypothetical protein
MRTTLTLFRRDREADDLSLDSVGDPVHRVLDLLRHGDVQQGALLDVLDWFLLPFLWIIGAFIAPTEHAAERAAGVA